MKNLLVAVDFSGQTKRLIELARSFGKSFGCHLWLIHVAAPNPEFVGFEAGPQAVRDEIASELHEDHQQLQTLAQSLRDQGLNATALMVQGPTVATLLEEARRLNVDHFLMGSHGRGGLMELFAGSVSKGVLQQCRVPVTLVGPQR